MTRRQFEEVEAVMCRGMQASVHDVQHVYRVLWAALRIAKTKPKADMDVVILSVLLHDIGRLCEEKQPGKSHAALGAEQAGPILEKLGWPQKTVHHVQACIRTHSYRQKLSPQSLEAKILFDADKLDLCGAIGTARALLFGAQIAEPLYLTDEQGRPLPGREKEGPSLLREYERKLYKMKSVFYTKKAKEMAEKRQLTMKRWFKALQKEVTNGYNKGVILLNKMVKP